MSLPKDSLCHLPCLISVTSTRNLLVLLWFPFLSENGGKGWGQEQHHRCDSSEGQKAGFCSPGCAHKGCLMTKSACFIYGRFGMDAL